MFETRCKLVIYFVLCSAHFPSSPYFWYCLCAFSELDADTRISDCCRCWHMLCMDGTEKDRDIKQELGSRLPTSTSASFNFVTSTSTHIPTFDTYCSLRNYSLTSFVDFSPSYFSSVGFEIYIDKI